MKQLLNCMIKNNFFLFIPSILIIPFFCLFFISHASAGVTAFDAVTVVKNPVKLMALTKGRFFSEGGRLVEFYLDEKHIGTTLSGGDGYAFLKYTPQTKGLKKIKLKIVDESDEARLLVTDKKGKVILIAIETGLFESAFSYKLAKGTKDAIDTLSEKYRIIYLTSLIGVKQSKKWLKENKLHESIVFSWTGNNLIEDIRGKEIKIIAIVASPDMLAEIEDIRKLSFKKAEGAEVVESWEDISIKLMKK